MKKLLLLLLVVAQVASAQSYKAVGARDDIRHNRFLSASNYTAYANQYGEYDHRQTAAPEGYAAFFVSTYARHGSRYLISPKQYDFPISVLQRADSLHQLTKTGKTLLKEIRELRAMATNERLGVLTEVGFDQHRELATRMCENFPMVFDKTAKIRAQSSYIPRCVKSMSEAVETIERIAGCGMISQQSGTPEIQKRMANWETPEAVKTALKPADSIYYAFSKKHTPMYRLQKQWFKYPGWTSDKCQAELVRKVFDLACNMQSHKGGPDLFRYFTDEECYELWKNRNVQWYLKHANAPQTQGMAPLKEHELLKDFVEDAVTQLADSNGHGATLRFGHDGCILPLMCLMGIEEVNQSVADLDTLDRVWRNYEIIPMAANVQVVFYRAAGKDVLLKVMVNEREMHLPLEAVNGVYYKWKDVLGLWEDRTVNSQ